MHASVTFKVSATETQKLVQINIVNYWNSSQLGNILYVDKTVIRTRYHLDRHPIHIWKCLKKYFMIYCQKCVFTEVAINGKMLAAWLNISDSRWGYFCASLYIITSVINKQRSHTTNVKGVLFAKYIKRKKQAKQMWLLNGEYWLFTQSETLGLGILPRYTFMPSLKKIWYIHPALISQTSFEQRGVTSTLPAVWAKKQCQDTWEHRYKVY